jgi:hypothetical protein
MESFHTPSDDVLYHRCPDCSYISRDVSCRLSHEDEVKRYRLHQNNPGDPGYTAWINRFLDFIFRTPLPAGSRVLDFGSGPEPVMASMLKNRGYDVSIEDPNFTDGVPEGLFHLITSLEVFEHLPDPRQVLFTLASRLTVNGRLCISTEFLPEDIESFDSWPYRSDATHIGFFTRNGLVQAAEEAGLQEENCDGKRYTCFRLAHRGSP